MQNQCQVCGNKGRIVSAELGVCLDCIRHKFDKAEPYIMNAHKRVREELKLPLDPPKDKGGLLCDICVNQCVMGKGSTGYCGIRKNEGGVLRDFGGATLDRHFEKFPVNIADEKSRTEKVMAVFYGACSFNCLFCQSWHYRDHLIQPNIVSAEELASEVDATTHGVYFYGGDPTPQIQHAIDTAKILLERNKGRQFRISFETNGSMNKRLLMEIAELVKASGGTIKYDIKAFDDSLHHALTGVTNKWTIENFKALASTDANIIVSTPLIPGYIDGVEVGHIAKYIAGIYPKIPYMLLGFYPQFYMYDLPTTSKKQAEECTHAARAAGLKHVVLGNKHLIR
jgi:pyruvate formate lyase activating enzyme